MTREEFLAAYRAALVDAYMWASDDAHLSRFMDSVQRTLNGASAWNHDGDAVVTAWRAIGGKGKPTLKALRALPVATLGAAVLAVGPL